MRDDFIPEGRPTCPDCGGYTEPDLLDLCHDADFSDRCDCEEAAASVAVEGTYSPLRDTRLYLGSDEPDCEVA